MSAPNQSWVSLNSCIYDYISEAELSENKYFKLFHLAFRCLEDLGIDFFYQIKTVKLDINANQTVTLPHDFLQYNKFGILNGVGELVPLKYNEKLTTLADLMPDRLSQVQSNSLLNYYSFSSPVFFNFWNGSSYQNIYGLPGSYSYGGGFKIDNQAGVILLDPSFSWTNLLMEYTASPKEGEEYYVPRVFSQAIVDWLAWKDVGNAKSASSHFNLGDKRDRRHEYFESRRKAIGKYRPFYLDQAYIQNLEAQRLCVKA